MHTYTSKKDRISAIMFGLLITIMIGLACLNVWTKHLLTIIIPLLVVMFILWIWIGTGYKIVQNSLTIRSGPFRWDIPVQDIHTIQPSRKLISSPALSLERLEIKYGTESILISPVQENDLIQELLRINPAIHIKK